MCARRVEHAEAAAAAAAASDLGICSQVAAVTRARRPMPAWRLPGVLGVEGGAGGRGKGEEVVEEEEEEEACWALQPAAAEGISVVMRARPVWEELGLGRVFWVSREERRVLVGGGALLPWDTEGWRVDGWAGMVACRAGEQEEPRDERLMRWVWGSPVWI